MEERFVKLQIVWEEDSPTDCIEIGITVRYNGWSAYAESYHSKSRFSEKCAELARWVEDPTPPFELGSMANAGVGSMTLKFYTIDRAGHARCAVKLATRTGRTARPEESWRIELEAVTEIGSIQRFAQECISMCEDTSQVATLYCLFR